MMLSCIVPLATGEEGSAPILPLDKGAGQWPSLAAGPRAPIEWTKVNGTSLSFFLNKTNSMVIGYNDTNAVLINTPPFDPYFAHNATVRKAIDTAPQWLNDTLSWKFKELYDDTAYEFAMMLQDPSIDWRYRDEIAFIVAYLNREHLNSYFMETGLILENVQMMYQVAEDMSYVNITDYNLTDGQHSTTVYNMWNGTYTLPEEVYYWYLAMPKNGLESPYYINTTEWLQTNSSAGVFWRSWLYNRTDDPGYPILKDYLIKETIMWNRTVNDVQNNGAVSAVTRWERESISFGPYPKSTHQPVIIYKMHVGMCGMNSEVLMAAAKIALIPTVQSLTLEWMHAWNEFYENGWHQWEGYSGNIDNPLAEGAPGSVSIFTDISPDGSQFGATARYTFVTNLTVKVKDRNGQPVDGALVRLTAEPITNYQYLTGLIGNVTDPTGETEFEVGIGRAYYMQVLTPLGSNIGEEVELPLIIPGAQLGVDYVINVTLNQSMPLKANLTRTVSGLSYGTSFNVTVNDLVQSTRFYMDPLSYGLTLWKGFPDSTGLTLYFLDSENLQRYDAGEEFWPAGVLNVTARSNSSLILPEDRDYFIVIPGLGQPMTRTFADLTIDVYRSDIFPEAMIRSPLPGSYPAGELIQFDGVLFPYPSFIGPITFLWTSNLTEQPLEDSPSFSMALPVGHHLITLTISNATGNISKAVVQVHIYQPNRGPTAVISSPDNGSVVDTGTMIMFSSDGSSDPDGDRLNFTWTDLSTKDVISYLPVFMKSFRTGDHSVLLNVSDGDGLFDTAAVLFSVLPPNNVPIAFIASPLPYSEHYVDELIKLSANGSFDVDGDFLSFRWTSSIDGVLSLSRETSVILSLGEHQITLEVSDGIFTGNASVVIYVKEREAPLDLPPVANISSPDEGSALYVNQMIFFSARGSYDPERNALTYIWRIDGNITSTEFEFSVYLPEGLRHVRLEVSDGRLSGGKEISLLIIDRSPVPRITLNGTNVTDEDYLLVTANDTLFFDAGGSYDPDGYGLEFEWSVDGETVGSSDELVTSFPSGTFELSLSIEDLGGNSATRTFTVISAEPHLPDNDDTDDDDDGGGGGMWSNPYIIIPLAVIVLCMVVIAVIWTLSRKTKVDAWVEE